MYKNNWIGRETLDFKRNEINKNTYNWMVMPNNLTETIKKTGVDFSLDLLSESFDKPYIDERKAFNNYPADASNSFVRKVFLKGNNKPMIFARVIIPEQTYVSYKSEFMSLGSKAIGNALLHHDKQVHRSEFEYKFIIPSDEIFNEIKELNLMGNQKGLWARRSVFTLPKGYLLITEVFLITLPVYPVHS
tara:strand:- start:1728 stop:2297 length:570 start_codon:yes stop_codon:yes gene_type:complete